MKIKMKICRECGKKKKLSAFGKRDPICGACRMKRHRQKVADEKKLLLNVSEENAKYDANMVEISE